MHYIDKLRLYGEKNNIPNISQENARFLQQLLKISHASHLLEIGTANGLSSIYFAQEMRNWDGKITTIDFSPHSHKEACKHFKTLKLHTMIHPILGNALDIIPQLDTPYDFVFIDAMKKRTVDFLKLVWDKTIDGGIIVIDDVIKFRHKMIGLTEYLEESAIKYTQIPIDTDDGIILIVK